MGHFNFSIIKCWQGHGPLALLVPTSLHSSFQLWTEGIRLGMKSKLGGGANLRCIFNALNVHETQLIDFRIIIL